MIGKLYKARRGSPHIVRVIGKFREMLRGEKLENTAHTFQVLAQRQKSIYDHSDIASFMGHPPFEDDAGYPPFTMEYELFMEEYEEIQ